MYLLVASRGVKAAVTRAFGEPLGIEELTLDPPGPGEVRVRIGAVAVCGSDLHAIDGSWGGALPAVFGHEAAGVVTDAGPDAESVQPGDRVVVSILRTCRSCFHCRRGEHHLCEATFALDRETRLHDAGGAAVTQGIRVGGFAEEVVVHESQAIRVPAELPIDRACLLACGVLTGYGAVTNTARVPPGASVVVVGIGGVGLNCVQAAHAAGAHPIVAVDVSAAKLDVAAKFGATDAVPAGPDTAGEVLRLTGRGADYAFVTVGHPRAVEQGVDLVRMGGTVVVTGMTRAGERAGIELSEFAASAKRVVGCRMGSAHLARDIPLLARHYGEGRLLLDELITGRYPVEQVNEAIASTRTGDALRNVIVFDGAGS